MPGGAHALIVVGGGDRIKGACVARPVGKLVRNCAEECVHDQGGCQGYLNIDLKVALVHVKSDGGSRD